MNVFIISLDCVRYDRVNEKTTPYIQGLKKEAQVFTNARAQSPWTPTSHASIFTGLYPHHHGIHEFGHKLKKNIPTIAGLLKKRGYNCTALFSYDTLYAQFNMEKDYNTVKRVKRGYNPDEMIEKLNLDSENEYLFIHLGDAHMPYQKMGEVSREITPFTEEYMGLTGSNADRTGILRNKILYPLYLTLRQRFVRPDGVLLDALEKVRNGEIKVSADDLETLKKGYDEGVKKVDEQVKNIFEALEKKGFLKDCIYFILSDHGEELYEHEMLGHACAHYETLTHIPLIVGGKGAGVNDKPVNQVDIAATILDGENFDGVNLFTDEVSPQLTQFSDSVSLKEDGWKAVAQKIGKKEFLSALWGRGTIPKKHEINMLYNLNEDPSEKNNLVKDERFNLMKEKIESIYTETYTADDVDKKIVEDQLRKLGYI